MNVSPAPPLAGADRLPPGGDSQPPAGGGPTLGHLVRSADYARVLAQPPRVRSPHFALHHLAANPSAPRRASGETAAQTGCTELSTDRPPLWSQVVEDFVTGWWLGTVCPKRHARRSVTRSLLKRQMRTAMQAAHPRLPRGLWVLRLKASFDRAAFVSAASPALRHSAHTELTTLLLRAAQPRRG